LSRNLNKIKLREKNADLLIFEKIKLLKSSEFFAPVHELQLLNLILNTCEPDIPSHDALHPFHETGDRVMVIRSIEGYSIQIPNDKIYEMMSGDPVMTARYLNLFVNNNHV
ncbi:MAG: hypothetical protein M0P58_04595, partial [Bacteroidales bacterium]|nr:hypothetical protein [Bacteroidales bacterium]